MARNTTPTFVTELSLKIDSQQEKELLARFQAGRQLYNACLGEAMTRMELVRTSELYQQAKNLPRFILNKKGEKVQNKARTKAFTEARKAYRYGDYELQALATIVSNQSKWVAQKIDSNTQQKLATRAFKASERVMLGQGKKVRYKVSSRFKSLEGKSNKQGLRWKDNKVVWGKLELKVLIDEDNPVINHGKKSKIKYVRILWRYLNGKRRWYVQLINEGFPYQKPQNYVASGTIGLDLNVSNIAFVGDNYAGLLPFAENVPTYQKEIGKLQRKMERSRRVNNPNNYHSGGSKKRGRKTFATKGLPKKGRQKWNNSRSYLKSANKKREIERKKAAYAKSQNRRLVNEILRHGKEIKTENVSVKGWQKRYGKAIAAKSPGFVQSELKRKAENAGGSILKFSTRKTALSQTHLDGTRIKKKLSERVHKDVTGVVMHRDLFSAFLSRFVNDDKLSVQDALNEYPGAEPLLEEAWKRYQKIASQVVDDESRRCHSPSEQFSSELERSNQIADCNNQGDKLG